MMNDSNFMKVSGASYFVALFGWFSLGCVQAEDLKEPKTEITGDIRDPREGEEIEGYYFFKGRTRGAPNGYVAMVFLSNDQHQLFYPYGEPGDANRSFSCEIYHSDDHFGRWGVHLYVLPEEDAEELAKWYREAARLAKVGQIDKIEAFDQELMKNAKEVASQHYKVNRD